MSVMNKNEVMKFYWENIRIIVETDDVCTQAARKYYTHIKRTYNERRHAKTEEEFLNKDF